MIWPGLEVPGFLLLAAERINGRLHCQLLDSIKGLERPPSGAVALLGFAHTHDYNAKVAGYDVLPPAIILTAQRTDDPGKMRTERPVFLSLFSFAWPVTAIASIAHRLTGIGLFVGIAFLLWLLDLALSSEGGFAEAGRVMSLPLAKLVVLFILANLIYHILAGVKHLLMDLHVGDSFEAASRSAWIVFVLTAFAVVAVGAWLW